MTARTKHVVLLGIGHTNAHVVKQWASEPIPGCTLTCISRFSTATYSGMLPGTLGGQFDDDEMRIDLQGLADRASAKLILADTCGLDLDNGQIHFSDHEPIPFDALSIGVGSMPTGWSDHADSPLMVPIKPMQTFIQRFDAHLSAANRPVRVSIVGGGVAGLEIAYCLDEKFRKRDPEHRATIEIFTSGDRIADGMTDRSIRRAEKLLATKSIAVHRGQRVTEVAETHLATEDGIRHATDCVVWATGASPPPVLATLGLQRDRRGFLATSETLQSLSDPRIFAVGDSGTVVKSPSPKAGVYAVRQCPILWHNLQALLRGGAMKSFCPQNDFLKILNTGDGKALLQYGWLTAHARWCWHLKTWIDKRFVNEFQVAQND
ncbi:FAD-dependent oxidoreductase [Neorhodopirellula pilleata]|uniref:NADH dehydrogenase-like protein YjlD n=1 Tax=Neorhodopirellula pilleata TaxID=2714738 RepID=A0A5C5ZQM1_9BACT|nr:FAD-dependent oxidoreductase [Neorhodopirellula pilleata]TWT89365.1 NADH dehydrogenase-like protein YjlD [Neorhodopirellula pilleata]